MFWCASHSGTFQSGLRGTTSYKKNRRQSKLAMYLGLFDSITLLIYDV